MQQPDWKHIWEIIRTYVLNKYILTLLIFAFVFLFIGEQSFIQSLKRSYHIRQTEKLLNESKQAIENTNTKLQNLENVDSLEQFAREKYLMHKKNEDVYLIK